MKSKIPVLALVLFFAFCILLDTRGKNACADGDFFPGKKAVEKLDALFDGHLRLQGNTAFLPENSVFQLVDTDTAYDGVFELRVKNRAALPWKMDLETHYELIYQGGDYFQKQDRLTRLGIAAANTEAKNSGFLFSYSRNPDQTRLMDLTKKIHQLQQEELYHRLDRLVLSLPAAGGTLRVGRQALTWGNGMIFHPMDLFNPFSPTDIVKDYKAGDDMAVFQYPFQSGGNCQVLCVPGRNPLNHKIETRWSSAAMKIHLFAGSNEFDFMAAKHSGNPVFGFGALGYLGSAVWRMDATATFPGDEKGLDDPFFTFGANLDYSFVWLGKNVYTMAEVYLNDLGEKDPEKALRSSALMSRLSRGEIFTLGRKYISGTMQVEVHPLFNTHFTAIVNMDDGSAILMPKGVWSAAQSVEIIFGANLYTGGQGTEFGGFNPGLPGLRMEYPDQVYCMASWYF